MSDNETTEKFDLNMHTFRLLQQEPFFASLSRRIHKAPSKHIPTAGVRINPQSAQFEMLYKSRLHGKSHRQAKAWCPNARVLPHHL